MRGWIIYNKSPETSYGVSRLLEEAEEQGVDVSTYSPDQFEIIVTKDGKKSILLEGEYPKLPDFVLPRTGASTSYYALALLRHFQRLNITVINTALAIDNVKDKLYTQQILAMHNLPVPRTMLVKFPVDADLVEKQIGFPAVVKTLSGSKGVGVFLCETRSKFIDLMELLVAVNRTDSIILQEFISDSHGRDLRAFVVGGRVVACMQRKATDGNFKANISRGGVGEPFQVTPAIEWLATETARVLSLDIAGIDLLFDGDYFKVCEANSSPGFEGIEKSSDVNIASEIYQYLRIRLGTFAEASHLSPSQSESLASEALSTNEWNKADL